MNFMNPQVEIRISRSIHSKAEWQRAVEEQVKEVFKKINRPFSKVKFDEALNDGECWRISLAGIDFRLKTI